MTKISRIVLISLLLGFAIVASAAQYQSKSFSIQLPPGMQLEKHIHNASVNLDNFFFTNNKASFAKSGDFIKLAHINQVPKQVSALPEWEYKTLGMMMATFIDSLHLSVEQQTQILQQKPAVVKLGRYRYMTTPVFHFRDMDAKFLVTVTNGETIYYTLAARGKANKRSAKIQEMIKSIKSARYLSA